MPIMLKRKSGESTPYRSAEYIPAYLYIPKSIIDSCPAKIRQLTRNPHQLFCSWQAIHVVESDLFLELIIDAYAYMVWPYLSKVPDMEIFSGFEPSWILAHVPAFWVQALYDQGFLSSAEKLAKSGVNEWFGYVSEEEVSRALEQIVPLAVERHNMKAVMETAEKYRCFEDFANKLSNQKINFYRKWYHTRTRHPQTSLEGFRTDYAQRHSGREAPEICLEMEEALLSKVHTDQFLAALDEKGRQILYLRLQGRTLEEVAARLGYKNHTGVLKRIRRIGQAYERFTGWSLGFDSRNNQ